MSKSDLLEKLCSNYEVLARDIKVANEKPTLENLGRVCMGTRSAWILFLAFALAEGQVNRQVSEQLLRLLRAALDTVRSALARGRGTTLIMRYIENEKSRLRFAETLSHQGVEPLWDVLADHKSFLALAAWQSAHTPAAAGR